MRLRISCRRFKGSKMFAVPEKLTVVEAADVCRRGLEAIAAGAREVDLSQLRRADSATVAVMLRWQVAASQHGAVLRFTNIPNGLADLISVYQTDDLLLPGAARSPGIARAVI